MEQPVLELQDLHTYFHTPAGLLKAVGGVSLTIQQGETLGLVGESGCGKSTLGNTVMRMLRPTAGKVLFEGKDIWEYSRSERKEYSRKVQMIFQDPYASLDPLNVVGDIIAEGMKVHHMYQGKELENRVLELMDMVSLNRQYRNRFPYEFSGGQRQRIGIARALSMNPRLIVCDEPISALDVSIQAQIVNLLRELQEQTGVSYLFITHDLSMCKYISDRIAVMYLGNIVELAEAESLFAEPLHPYTQALMSAIPVADPREEAARRRIILQGDVPSPVNLKPGCPFAARCPQATERCYQEKPQLQEKASGHCVACHLV